jgi:hypothetical protein
MFYLWFVLLAPRVRPTAAAALTVCVTFAIEFLKLYHAPWIDEFRANRVAGFLMGHGFYWHDLLCYLVGTGLAMAFDVAVAGRGRS